MQDAGRLVAAPAQAAFDIEQAAEIAADHGIGPVAWIASHLRSTICVDNSPNLTAKAPPNPQHSSQSAISVRLRPGTACNSWRGWRLMPNPRRPLQESW